jgi:hypothetical protein
MDYTFRDWHMKAVGTGKVGPDGVIEIPSDKPIFCIELSR